MNSLSLLGIVVLILANVFLSPGGFEDVRVGFGGLNSIKQSHLLDITDLYQVDNYNLDSKDEENPRYSVLSVRPDKTAYLNATGSSVRGLWDFSPTGVSLIVFADKNSLYETNGTSLVTLETNFQDQPWEATEYLLPSGSHLYLCHGADKNKKILSFAPSKVFNMQDQDNETLTGGNVWFTNYYQFATGDATAISSLTTGNYIKSSTTADDDKWMEITSIEGTTINFANRFTGTTGVSTVCVRSNDVVNSRHIINYSGHIVLGYTNNNPGTLLLAKESGDNLLLETGDDIYIDTTSLANISTLIYSKRYHPENFPTLNTFQLPGTIVGLAETGGYLVVGTVKPDAFYFYSETNDPTDGLGIDFVTSINGLTFGGGSHSIAYLPKGAGFIFYSGLGVYLQNGLSTTLLSGQIREEAKKMSAYRSPLDYYGGFADAMPQAIVDVTKDTYRLAVPNDKGQNSYIYNYNYGNSTWTRWTNLYPTAMLYRPETGSEPTTYFGNVSGEVYAINKTGSVNTGAELSWFFSGKDISKIKNLNTINIMVRKDNPLIGCVATLEITSPDSVGDIVITKNLTDNTTKDAMERLVYLPNINAREFKIKLTQSSSQGAVGIRAIQYKGAVKGDY